MRFALLVVQIVRPQRPAEHEASDPCASRSLLVKSSGRKGRLNARGQVHGWLVVLVRQRF